MSEEQNAPKKAARKRVVKKGVRGTRAPRKKTVIKKENSPAEADETAHEDFSAEENEMTYSLDAREPEEAARVEEPKQEIAVVEEDARENSRNRNTRSPKKNEANESSNEDREESPDEESEEPSGDEEERKEGRRRNRNRRGGKDREREESPQKARKIDRDEAAAKAWEIYQGELEEEGVSLVDPRRARDVARRCLELATVFCEERDRYLER